MAAAAVDRVYRCLLNSICTAQACFGDCVALPWSLFGGPLASHWGTLANLGTHFGHLRLHWGVLQLPWGCFGDDFGLFWASSEKELSVGTPPQADGSQVPRLRTKIDSLELADGSRRSRRSRRNGPRTTVQTLRSTRAGGQDDVSFTNSLKL